MQIAIIGNSYCTKRLVEELSFDSGDIIFTCNDSNFESINQAQDFIAANQISLLIDTQYGVIGSDIEDMNIPYFLDSASSYKKFAYKNKIQTAKFALYEKMFAPFEFLQNFNLPVIIQPDIQNPKQAPYIADTMQKLQKRAEFLFEGDNKKILIEEYISGIEYTEYIAFDGVNIINLFCCVNYFDEISTNNTRYVPESAILKIQNEIMPVILDRFMEDEPDFHGILGISFVIDKTCRPFFTKFKPFFDDLGFEIASLLYENNLKNLLNACANGKLNKDFENAGANKYVIAGEIEDAIPSLKLCAYGANTMLQAVNCAKELGINEKKLDEALRYWKN